VGEVFGVGGGHFFGEQLKWKGVGVSVVSNWIGGHVLGDQLRYVGVSMYSLGYTVELGK